MEIVIPDCAEQIVTIIKKHKFLNGNIFYDILCLNCKLSDLNSSAMTYKIFPIKILIGHSLFITFICCYIDINMANVSKICLP